MKTLDNKLPFSTPDGYFDQMKTRLKAIPKEEISQIKDRPVKRFVLFSAIAAALALLLTAGGFFLGRISEERSWEILASGDSITDEDIVEYLIYIVAEEKSLATICFDTNPYINRQYEENITDSFINFGSCYSFCQNLFVDFSRWQHYCKCEHW